MSARELLILVSLKVSADPTHEPRNLSGEAISSTSIYIQWDPPPSEHHNGVIDSYTVLCSETDTERILSSHTTPTTSIAIRNLHPFYTYECNVSAVTVGHGPFSETIAVTTWEDGMLVKNIINSI